MMSVRGKRGEKPGPKIAETGATNGEVPAETKKASDNKVPIELTADQTLSLTHQWVKKVGTQQDDVEAAKAEYDSQKGTQRELYKQVKAELGQDGVERVKELVKLNRDEDGEEKLRQRIETLLWLVQYAGALPGQQLELLSDVRPTDERAFADGKRAGLAGDPFNPRYGQGTDAYRRFQDGYQAGQEILAKGFKPLEKPPESIGDAEPTHDVQA